MPNPLTDPLKGLSKNQKIAAVAGATSVGGYFVYSHHKKTGSWNPWSSGASTTNSAGDATTIDPVTGLAYSQDAAVDPITGLGYLAEAEQYGSVASAEASVSAYGQSTATGAGIPVNPASPQSSGSLNTPVGSSVYTSNAAWSQAVQAGLTDVGYDPVTVATALGLYLTQQPMTASQAQIISAGIAEFGGAPVGSLQIILLPPSGPASTPVTTPSSGTSKPPAIPAMPSGVTVTAVTSNGFTVNWKAVSGATSYPVRVTYQSALVWEGTATGTSIKVTGLGANRTYTVHVAAKNSAGTSSETNGPAQKTKA